MSRPNRRSHQILGEEGRDTRGLNLKANRDQILVLIGRNGSGKTTFLNLISSTLRPTSGTPTVMGYGLGKQSLDARLISAISFQVARGFLRH